jgi:hypothetical protein
VLALPAVACIVLFGLGEVSSVLAINARHATAFEHLCVVAALVSLPIVLVLVTAGSIITTGSRELKAPERGDDATPPV